MEQWDHTTDASVFADAYTISVAVSGHQDRHRSSRDGVSHPLARLPMTGAGRRVHGGLAPASVHRERFSLIHGECGRMRARNVHP